MRCGVFLTVSGCFVFAVPPVSNVEFWCILVYFGVLLLMFVADCIFGFL